MRSGARGKNIGHFTLMTTYLPNGEARSQPRAFKMEYNEAFLDYVLRNKVRADGKKVVFTGDINTAHNEIDLARPKQNAKTTGFLREERDWSFFFFSALALFHASASCKSDSF